MAEKEVKTSFNHSHNLEEYVLLAKSARGAGVVALIQKALEAPGVYVFGELMEMPSVKELEKSENSGFWNLLNIFALGTFAEYKANSSSLPALSPPQLKKLRHLTIVSLAAKSKFIPYSVLLEELDIKNLRELEDLIIDAIYADIIHGKLDQKNKQLEVDFAIGRDITPDTINRVTEVLQDWLKFVSSLLKVENLKKAIKASSQSDIDNGAVSGMPPPYHSQQYQQKALTSTKTKGLRGSGKVFGTQVRR
ncbi:PREDICTED: COP9 signalosome complex subunit 7b-like [Acropora digitifera]|uniref:COP9 signalosome complex subunit 7b-like n=1 Tax=Acropora digitifera TaxID=70779 RepID=UPI00077A114F|nr:PREDICTED: COP9 signalosome complex subunit 7b-like [Acropora digitifera]